MNFIFTNIELKLEGKDELTKNKKHGKHFFLIQNGRKMAAYFLFGWKNGPNIRFSRIFWKLALSIFHFSLDNVQCPTSKKID